jgi:hypothetical protein
MGFRFNVAPSDQGQIVEVAYGMWVDMVYRRVTDRGDRTVTYAVSKALAGDDGDYWNGAPLNRRWKKISERDFRRAVEQD